MSVEAKANKVLEKARAIAPTVGSWADFSNALFGHGEGIIAKTFGTSIERQAFFDSKQYEEINEILLSLMKKFGTGEGAKPKKSGKLLVRMPTSLHELLVLEAKSEGVSLNQLIVSKMALPLRDRTKVKSDLIIE